MSAPLLHGAGAAYLSSLLERDLRLQTLNSGDAGAGHADDTYASLRSLVLAEAEAREGGGRTWATPSSDCGPLARALRLKHGA